ncbi:tryptophan halogenase family protein [Sphingomonas guangdongensis]|nr:tryptophan halogenase family protein [Sphingomonas guangdongensis]
MTGEQRVRRVVIAGGGTAGWLAAAALSHQLGKLLDITLVESDEIGTVGVGEATIPTVRSFHALIGLDEREFLRATNATFKLGISFENWARIGDRYIHSFGTLGRSTWMGEFHHFWLHARAAGVADEIGAYCLEHEAAAAERFAGGEGQDTSYAFHLDATLYARHLRARSEAAGVRRIEGKIARVDRDGESGEIRALVLDSGAEVPGDLFIDCTGFRALLLGETLGVGFEDWGEWLQTDRALAVQTESTRPAVPYTRAVAHDAGWRWQIPLQNRVGNGLVYASAFLDDDAARERLLASLDGPTRTEPRLIRYRTGRREQSWAANCVSLGLSSGFVEPLESTSIHLIMIGITRLMQLFPFGGCHEGLRRRFNAQSRTELERVRDFIILHYKLTERDDSPFWRRCRDMSVPQSLADRIALWVEDAHAYQGAEDLFRVDSWVQVMLGQRLQPGGHHLLGRIMPDERLRQTFEGMRRSVRERVASMPAHGEFLKRYAA